MSLNNEDKQSTDREDSQPDLAQQMRSKAAEYKSRFLAAKKSTQYALAGGAVVVLVLLISFGSGSSDIAGSNVTFEVRKGQLDITVLEGGSLEALQSQEIRSRVKGREGVKILTIVEEGYRVTPEDVAAGIILVELDTSQLIDQQLNQEIAVETAEATFIERRAQYEIQLNENVTSLNDARQDMRFARLDFEKFLGATVVNQIISDLDIEARLAAAEEADRVSMALADRVNDDGTLQQIAQERAPQARI